MTAWQPRLTRRPRGWKRQAQRFPRQVRGGALLMRGRMAWRGSWQGCWGGRGGGRVDRGGMCRRRCQQQRRCSFARLVLDAPPPPPRFISPQKPRRSVIVLVGSQCWQVQGVFASAPSFLAVLLNSRVSLPTIPRNRAGIPFGPPRTHLSCNLDPMPRNPSVLRPEPAES